MRSRRRHPRPHVGKMSPGHICIYLLARLCYTTARVETPLHPLYHTRFTNTNFDLTSSDIFCTLCFKPFLAWTLVGESA